MLLRRRLLISLSASLLLVLAQLMVLDHVHASDEPTSICAYCISSADVDAAVTATPQTNPIGVSKAAFSTVLLTRCIEARHNYASRAPPAISS